MARQTVQDSPGDQPRRHREGSFPELPGNPVDLAQLVDWREYVAMFRRRWVIALVVFLVALSVGIVYGLQRVPVYQAKVRLLIDRDRSNLAGVGDVLLQDLELDFQTQLTILQSRSLARRTMQTLGIWDGQTPENPPTATQRIASNRQQDSARVDAFLSAIRVSQVPASRLVDVFYTSVDPATAARYANALADQYIRQAIEDRSSAAKEVTQWLTDRLSEQRKTIEASEKALQSYREQNVGAATRENTTLLVQKLTDLITVFTKAKTERIEKGALYTQVQTLQRNPSSLEGFPPILSNPVVQQLKNELVARQKEETSLSEKLGSRHPALIKAREATNETQARLDAQIAKVVESIGQDYVAAQETEAKLDQELNVQKRESMALNRSDVQLAVLQRDAESNRQIYDSLNQRVNEFAVVRQRRGNNVSIVDPAEVPQAPQGTSTWDDVRNGGLGGVLLALCVVFVVDRFDNRVKTPGQINALGLSLLGLIPRVEIPAGAPRRPLPGRQTSAAFDEAFRALRTNVRLTSLVSGSRTILVTSPCSGDGKSLLAAGLAATLADGGHDVVLIDADLRRPSIHFAFDVPQQPGLSEVLTSQATVSSTLRPVHAPVLSVLTSGTHPPNPSELLDSDQFRQVLGELRRSHEWVIIDSPPVGPVTDAVILASEVDDVIVVVAAEVTPMPMLRAALEQLGRTTARVLGVVLNRADLQRRGYYYSAYYHPDYDRYYLGAKQPTDRSS